MPLFHCVCCRPARTGRTGDSPRAFFFRRIARMRNPSFKFMIFLCCVSFLAFTMNAQEKPASKPRARDLGVPFDGTPGPLNAITDVAGVLVGHTTRISVQ